LGFINSSKKNRVVSCRLPRTHHPTMKPILGAAFA
jgi:hypothetical protein